jgi:hypothetical protein
MGGSRRQPPGRGVTDRLVDPGGRRVKSTTGPTPSTMESGAQIVALTMSRTRIATASRTNAGSALFARVSPIVILCEVRRHVTLLRLRSSLVRNLFGNQSRSPLGAACSQTR